MPTFTESLDAAASSSTTYSLTAGQSIQGTLTGSGDHDWYRVTLTAGQTYTFALSGTGTNNVIDTFLRLYAADGTTVLADNDDGLPNLNSLITYTATTSGTYYLDASSFQPSTTGQYQFTYNTGNRIGFDTSMGAGVIDTNYAWNVIPGAAAIVTYGFRTTNATYAGSVTDHNLSTFSRLTASEMATVRNTLRMWSEICNVNFIEVNPGGYTDSATILFSNYTDAGDGSGAFAYYPGSTVATDSAGDVWLNTTSISTTQTLDYGSYGFFAIMHELGHAIGLSHPGLYNAAPGLSITYANNAQFTQDTQQYTIMSYFDETSTGGNFGAYANSPMLFDIYAAQRIYGANMLTRNTNTTYGFNSNAGAPYNFTTGTTRAFCIWDGGGTDTIDASGYSQAQTINLNAESFSNIGGLTSNISIANGVVVENAIGGSNSDTITGNSADNTLDGGAGMDNLSGADGNDTLFGRTGNDSLNGGLGTDTLIADGPVSWDASAASIYRLYLTTLRRAPDDGGFANWVNQMHGGTTLTTVTSGFINSAEFSLVYGSLNNTQFVTTLYANALNRTPDSAGLNHWVSLLNSGSSRESVVNGFSESMELRLNFDVTRYAGEIYRMYDSAFNRQADFGGFEHWVNNRTGGSFMINIANSFINSAEFTLTYGNINTLTNTQYITLLYNNVLNRAPDASGLSFWQNLLSNGMSRAEALLNFSESAEHINIMAGGLNTFMHTQAASWNDVLTGGTGDDYLTGGRGADTFVFSASTAGNDHVYGFERIDNLTFSGFGFTNASNALSRMTQQGADVVFTMSGSTVTFHDTQLSEIQALNTSNWSFA